MNLENNHRYTVVVKDFATRWIQSYPCKTPNFFRRRKGIYENFLEPLQKSWKVILQWQLIHWSLANLVKNYQEIIWYINASTVFRRMVLLRRAVRRIKEGTSCCGCYSRAWTKKWWADSTDCYCNLRHVQDLLADGETAHGRRFGANHLKVQ